MAKIHIIEDDPQVREVLSVALQKAGYVIREASNGREAIDLIINDPPDLIITDIIMPDMDGLELLMGLRGTKSDLPVIAISGVSVHSETYLRAAAHLGARKVLMKPFSEEDLLSAVAEALPKKGS